MLTLLHGQRIPAPKDVHTRGDRAVELRVPARAEQLAVVRAITGSLAGYEDLDPEAATDLSLAVDEACTVLIDMAAAGATLVLVEDPRAHEVTVRVSTTCDAPEDDAARITLNGFSRRVLEALTDTLETFCEDRDAGPGFGISLTTRRRWASARGQRP